MAALIKRTKWFFIRKTRTEHSAVEFSAFGL